MEKALNRQKILLQHLKPTSFSSTQTDQAPSLSASICAAGDSAAYHRQAAFSDDVVIVAAYRTAICKAKRGGFKNTHADDLLAHVLKALIEKTKLNPSEVGDIVVGTVLAPGSLRAMECRMAAFYAGVPETVPIRTDVHSGPTVTSSSRCRCRRRYPATVDDIRRRQLARRRRVFDSSRSTPTLSTCRLLLPNQPLRSKAAIFRPFGSNFSIFRLESRSSSSLY